MEPDRFDDVGFEILESPDERRPRRRIPRRTAVAVAASVLSAAALAAGAALALTPSSTPAPAAVPARSHFVDEHYPARGEAVGRDDFARDGFSSGRHHDCPFKQRRSQDSASAEL